jgi:ribosomal peptide maturation radical SAM protein 1
VQGGGCSTGELVALGPPAVRSFGDDDDINDPVELDYVPFIDQYESNFPGEPQPTLLFETSRGCWWGERAHCTFCGLNGSTISYRAMTPPRAIQVLDSLFQHSDRVTHLQSVDNILPKSYLTDVLPYLDTPDNMDLFYEVKADLGEEEFKILARARVKLIQPGIEALNTGTLKLMRKGTSSFQNLQFLINCARYEIEPGWNLLIGFPGEEIQVYEKYLEDLPLLTHLPPPGGVFPVRFDRFSPYYTEADEYKLQLHPLDWYELTYPYPIENLMRLAYYFSDRNYGAQYAMNVARMVGRLREKVDRWIGQWEHRDRCPRLELRTRDGRTTVLDSRTGETVEYPIREDTRRVLEALAKAKKPANLAEELGDVDVEAELALLKERGLIFHENDRVISLIVPPAAPLARRIHRTELDAVAA